MNLESPLCRRCYLHFRLYFCDKITVWFCLKSFCLGQPPRAFCRETRYIKFTRLFRPLKNIVQRVHLARFAPYRVHIARSLQKNIAQGWSWWCSHLEWLATGKCKERLSELTNTVIINIFYAQYLVLNQTCLWSRSRRHICDKATLQHAHAM